MNLDREQSDGKTEGWGNYIEYIILKPNNLKKINEIKEKETMLKIG